MTGPQFIEVHNANDGSPMLRNPRHIAGIGSCSTGGAYIYMTSPGSDEEWTEHVRESYDELRAMLRFRSPGAGPTKVRWEIGRADTDDEVVAMCTEGWEPLSVTVEWSEHPAGEFVEREFFAVHHFRRQVDAEEPVHEAETVQEEVANVSE